MSKWVATFVSHWHKTLLPWVGTNRAEFCVGNNILPGVDSIKPFRPYCADQNYIGVSNALI
jgi:hypothetical protein